MSRKREKGRGFFGRGRHDDGDDEFVVIDDESNRWWADREQLNTTFSATRTEQPGPESPREQAADKGGFHAYFTTESLFDDGGRRRPGATSDADAAHDADPSDPTAGSLPRYPGHGRDPFEVLGVRPGASLAEITIRHRQLAKQYHPDLHDDHTRSEAEQVMIEVNAAYSELRRVLRNVERLRVTAS